MKIKSKLNFIHNKKLFFKDVILYSLIAYMLSYVFFESLLGPNNKRNASVSIKASYLLHQLKLKTNIINSKSFPLIELHVKQKHWNKIAFKRDQALKNYVPGLDRLVNIKTSDDWINAIVSLEDSKKISSKIRLKGRLKDHWSEKNHWSLNIKLKGDHTFQGMKKFSIQHPYTRNFTNEWLFHQLLKHHNLIALRYDFCYVSINGKDKLVYAYEEGLDKRLIENNNLREGIILKLNSDYNWYFGYLNQINFSNTDIAIYNEKQVNKNPTLRKQADKAIGKLNAFRQGTLKTSQVFDIKKWATFFSILEVFGRDHAAQYDNCRLYYNPVTTLIEPIGRDNQIITPREKKPLMGDHKLIYQTEINDWIEQFFKDPLFFKAYINALENICNNEKLNQSLELLKEELDNKYTELKLHFPKAIRLKKSAKMIVLIHYNAAIINKKLFEQQKDLQITIQKLSPLTINIENTSSFPINLLSVSNLKKDIHTWPKGYFMQSIQMDHYSPIKKIIFDNIHLNDKNKLLLSFTYRYFGGTQVFHANAKNYSSIVPALSTEPIKNAMDINQLEFLNVNAKSKTITIANGSWIIKKPLVFPKGYKIVAASPLTLDLINNAFILSYSPLHLRGSSSDPIQIKSSDKTGSLTVIKTPTVSQFFYTNFHHLNCLNQNNWTLTGSITLYEADAKFKNCQFSNNHSEDALNSIRSVIHIDDSQFSNIESDAFDGDFVKGYIKNSSFTNIGNDAIDISGSTLQIKSIFIKNAGDKGISIGEKSKIDGTNIEISSSAIGIASKDSSIARLKNVILNDLKLGVTAYQKKPEFKGGFISILNFKQSKIKLSHLREKGSTIKLNKIMVDATNKKIKNILYGVEFGKSSK